MKKLLYLVFIGLAGLLISCDPQIADDISLPDAPVAAFIVEPLASNPNKLVFTATSEGAFLYTWNFGNGVTSTKVKDTVYYAFKGDYQVQLTVSAKGGEGKSVKAVNVPQSDPSICNDAILKLLTGGCDATNGKIWVMDRNIGGHLGVGPKEANTPDWYSAAPNEKESVGCLYDDEINFKLKGYLFKLNNKGTTYFNAGTVMEALGKPNPASDECYEIATPEVNYAIVSRNGKTYIKLTNNAFMSYYEGAHEYEVLELTKDLLRLRAEVSYGYWYYRFIPKDNATPPPPPVANFTFSPSVTNSLEIGFTNASANASTYAWEFGDGGTSTEKDPKHTYAAGTYQVKLTATGSGGSNTVTKTVKAEVTTFSLATFLNGGSSRSWKLAPIAGALLVGPGDGSAWYQNTDAEIAPRSCMFNDEYVFTSTGSYKYKANGDGWKNWELFKSPTDVCISETEDWFNKNDVKVNEWKSSDTHTYTLVGQVITVTGKGAFIGLPDSGTDLISHVPQDFSTYTVMKTEIGTTSDKLYIRGKGAGSDGKDGDPRPGFWDFILTSPK